MSQQSSQPVPRRRSGTHADGIDQAMAVLSYLFGGIIVYGGLGWVGAHFLHAGVLLPIGIVFGVGLGVYLIVRHYGSPGEQAATDWIEQRNAVQDEWTERSGRPAELGRSNDPNAGRAPAAAPAGTGSGEQSTRRTASEVLRRR